MKSRGGSITSCLSRSTSSDSELNMKLLAMNTTPPRPSRNCSARKISESSAKWNLSFSTDTCCRICHEGDHEEVLLTVCRCLGSIKHVHHSCLLNWISRSGDLTCELCKYDYEVTKTQKTKLSEWRFPAIGMQGWLHLVLFLAFFAMLMTSVTWVIWSQTSRSSAAIFERTSAEIKYAYMLNGIFIITAVIGISLDSVRQAKKYFQRVLALNQEIFIEEYVGNCGSISDEKRHESLPCAWSGESELPRDIKHDKYHGCRESFVKSLMDLRQSSVSYNHVRNSETDHRDPESKHGNADNVCQDHMATNPLNYSMCCYQDEDFIPMPIDDSVFIEIDLDQSSFNSNMISDDELTFDYSGNFETLDLLAETCI